MGFFDRYLKQPPHQAQPARPREERPAWAKPEAVLPAVVPIEAVLGRSPQAAIAVPALSVYTTGFEFTLMAVLRSAEPRRPGLGMLHWPGRDGVNMTDDFLRLAVVFADGRVATNVDRNHGPEVAGTHGGAVLLPAGGGGGSGNYAMKYWVYPLPPAGPLSFICEWPSFGIAESRTELDAQPILDAVARTVQLWPEDTDQ